jgi:hypothetical protein
VRELGFARERDEAVLGESSLAAPIFDHSGHAVGAIGAVGDTERLLPRDPARGLTTAVLEAARVVPHLTGVGDGRSAEPSERPSANGAQPPSRERRRRAARVLKRSRCRESA